MWKKLNKRWKSIIPEIEQSRIDLFQVSIKRGFNRTPKSRILIAKQHYDKCDFNFIIVKYDLTRCRMREKHLNQTRVIVNRDPNRFVLEFRDKKLNFKSGFFFDQSRFREKKMIKTLLQNNIFWRKTYFYNMGFYQMRFEFPFKN